MMPRRFALLTGGTKQGLLREEGQQPDTLSLSLSLSRVES